MEIEKTNGLDKFEEANNIMTDDSIYKYDGKEIDRLYNVKPWKQDPFYFKKVKISATALIKMVNHAKMGAERNPPVEVMGLMQGKFEKGLFIIFDSFPLPIEGSETRVNAGAEADNFMIEWSEDLEKVGRKENNVGWYHSHPGFGCWLSGIDVATQHSYQVNGYDPWLSVVIDPIRTLSSGRVEIGAFRTFPQDFVRPEDEGISSDMIPEDKLKDFGVHFKRYYPLDVSFFKSSLDSQIIQVLWNKYWMSTLSSSNLLVNKDYYCKCLKDVSKKAQSLKNTFKKSRGQKTDTLIGKGKYNDDFVKFSIEKNSASLSEALRGMMF